MSELYRSRNKDELFISVIIPVFNDAKGLRNCLQALSNQTYDKSMFEIIVVDNNSDEDIKSVVAQFKKAQYTHESQPGSYVARNKGIFVAKGEIIAFTDADCLPNADWIEKGVNKLLGTPNCGVVGGKIEVIFKNPGHPTAIELFDSITAFPQQHFIEKDNFSATANTFTFRSVINHVGDFNSKLKSNGDREWGNRVFSSNYKLVYADDTCVFHPARYSYAQMRKKYARLVGGQYDLQQNQNIYSLKLFVRSVIRDLKYLILQVLELLFAKKINSTVETKIHNTWHQIQLTRLILFIRYVMVTERIRLHFGGQSQRG